MKIVAKPLPIVLAALAVGSLLLGSPLVAAVLGAAFLVTLAFGAIRSSAHSDMPHPSELSGEAATLLHPLTKLRDELAEIVRQNGDLPEVKVIGEQAFQEAQTIVAGAVKMLSVRASLKKTLRGRGEAKVGSERLEQKLAEAQSDEERAALQSAIAARREEADQYGAVEQAIGKIDGKLREAEAALAELKARLATGAAQARTAGAGAEDLSEMVSRLRSLGDSFTEVESMIEVNAR